MKHTFVIEIIANNEHLGQRISYLVLYSTASDSFFIVVIVLNTYYPILLLYMSVCKGQAGAGFLHFFACLYECVHFYL